jgi:hypothetical protein
VRIVCTFASALYTSGCGGDVQTTCLPLREGVRVIANVESAAREVPRFEELWRRGGTREGEELSVPLGVAAGPNGRIAIADFQLAEIIVVDGDGTWHGSWTRTGGGPGETRHPVAAAWRADGALVVFDILGNRIVTLRDGEPLPGDVQVDPGFACPSVSRGGMLGITMQPGAPILLTEFEQVGTDGTFTGDMQGLAMRLDVRSGRVDTLAAPVYPNVEAERWGGIAAPGWPRPVAAAGGEYAAVAAADGSYRVVVLNASGRAVRQICRDAPPLPLHQRELGTAATAELADLAAAVAGARRPPTPAAIGRLVVTREGGVWVQRERPGSFGTTYESFQGVPVGTYDVFDALGRYTSTVTAPDGARIQAVAGDTAWAFIVGDLDETWLAAYRLIR